MGQTGTTNEVSGRSYKPDPVCCSRYHGDQSKWEPDSRF